MAVLTGKWVDYAITYNASSYVLTDRRGFDGTDTFHSTERFEFSDQPITVTTQNDLLNEAPTDITFVGDTVNVGSAPGTIVSTMGFVDPDAGDTFSWAIVGGATADFTLNGNEIIGAGGLAGRVAGDVLVLDVRITDAGGLSYVETVNITLTQTKITGTAGDDNLVGTAAGETIEGLAGNDVIQGFMATDQIDGGADNDTVSYVAASGGVTIDLTLAGPQNTVSAGMDQLISIENIIGSNFNDTLTGDNNANVINGLGGNDLIDGAGGNDTLIGGLGVDTLTYANTAAGVTVNISLLTAQNTVGAGTDTISEFENLIGTAFADTLTGDSVDNVIFAGDGDDIVEGSDGNDTLTGGNGVDTVTYVNALADVTFSLATLTAQTTVGAGTDTVSGFENLTGSGFNDTLTGDSSNNVIDAGGGNDTVDGGDGDDALIGGSGTDTVSYANAASGITFDLSLATAQNTVGAGTDTVSGFENVTGSGFDDIIVGTSGNNILTGDAGTDTLSYANAVSDITFDLSLATAQATGGGGTDTVSGFENLIASGFDDVIAGTSGNNVLEGGAGIDTISYASALAGVTFELSLTTAQNTVGAGTDTVSGFENVTGSGFDDVITGTSGNNTLVGGSGTDTISYANAASGVTFDLSLATAQNTGGAGTDTVSGFENVIGSDFNDIITGTTGNNTLAGGIGTDTISYSNAISGITFDLSLTTAQVTGGAGTDTVSGFENITGSGFDDLAIRN